jgi:hypothetical protein
MTLVIVVSWNLSNLQVLQGDESGAVFTVKLLKAKVEIKH